MTDGQEAAPGWLRVHVRSLAEALTAAEAARHAGAALDLVSAPGVAQALGIGWFCALREIVRERFPGLVVSLTVDCGKAAGTAQGALRRGIDRVVFRGNGKANERLVSIAAQHGATILTQLPEPTYAQDGLTRNLSAW